MEDLMAAVKELNCVVSNFPVGAESTQMIFCEDFDKLEKAFNEKKGELYVNAAYKEELPVKDSQTTIASSSEAVQDYLKEKYMKECRDLLLRNVGEMLSLENASKIEDDGNFGDIKRRILKISQDILEVSEEDDAENRKLYEKMVSKEMKLLELMHKYQEANLKLKEKEAAAQDSFAEDEQLEQRKKSIVDKINFMKRLTVNLVGCSGTKLSENPDIVMALVEKCQPIKYEDIDKL